MLHLCSPENFQGNYYSEGHSLEHDALETLKLSRIRHQRDGVGLVNFRN